MTRPLDVHPLLDCALTRLARCADPFNPSALNILLYYARVLKARPDTAALSTQEGPPDIAEVAPVSLRAERILGKVLPAAVAATLAGAWVPLAITGLRILRDHSDHLGYIMGRLG
jgi:hypothetical protein